MIKTATISIRGVKAQQPKPSKKEGQCKSIITNLQLLDKEMRPDQDEQRSTTGDQSHIGDSVTDNPDKLTKNLIDKIPGGSDIE